MLRQAGCVFAEEEADILLAAAKDSCAREAADSCAHQATDACAHETTSCLGAPSELLGEFLARRVAGEPLEQIVGWVEFAGQRIAVAPGAFVPRQRTALLAQQSILAVQAAKSAESAEAAKVGEAAKSVQVAKLGEAAKSVQVAKSANRGDKEVRFLEAFCGVGPVATTVSRAVPGTRIHLGDHDKTALDCARANVGPQAHFDLLDCLSGLPQSLAGGFDVISAVPPYVPDSAAEFLPHEAVDYEAQTALFGGADGLDLIRSLICESCEWMAPGGVVLIELGSDQQHTAVEFAAAKGFAVSSILGEDGQTVVLELRSRD